MKTTEKNIEDRFCRPKPILAFSNTLLLKAIFCSSAAAEKLTGVKHQALFNAIKGNSISAKGFYWREVDDDLEISQDDVGTLSLLDFDKEMGDNRLIYATRSMRPREVILESQYANRFNYIHKNGKNQSKGDKHVKP